MADFAGVPLREHVIDFPVTPAEALAANRSQRTRLVSLVESLSEPDWAQPSRCDAWSVQDVVGHLVDINEVILDGIATSRAGERSTRFQGFDPKTTPEEWVSKRRGEPVAATLDAFRESTRQIIAEMESLDGDLLISTPAGRQPWHRGILHALFDSAVHERDIALPLGRRVEVETPEMRAIAAYQLLLNARILAVVGVASDEALLLEPDLPFRYVVDGASVRVNEEPVDGAARGDAAQVRDAMTGRGELADVLTGSPDAAGRLGALRQLL